MLAKQPAQNALYTMRKKHKVNLTDIPEQTPEQLKQFKRVTPEQHERFVQAYRNTFGKEPPSLGRPKKPAHELYQHVHMRIHPKLLARTKAKAKRLGIGYQTLITRILADHL